VALLLFLVPSPAIAQQGQPRVFAAVRGGELPAEGLLVAPLLFTLFVIITAIDAAFLARARGYLSGRALLQVLLALAFVAFLVPQAYDEYRARKAPPSASPAMMSELVRSRDARVRSVVMELAGFRGPPQEVSDLLARGLRDSDPMVRSAALNAVSRLSGEPLEDPERAQAILRGWGVRERESPPGL
jgi:hypothetical protein